MTENRLQIEIESESKYLEAVRNKLKAFLAGRGFSDKTVESILVAMGEACTNSIRHSYGNEPGHPVSISAEDMGHKVLFKIKDEGQKIDLTKVKKPQLPPEKSGGLGLYFMETLMDEMSYNTSLPHGNELILVKNKDKGDTCRENSD